MFSWRRWQFPSQTVLCAPGRPKPGSLTAVLKIVDKRSRFLILDTYLLLMEEGVPCPAPAAKLTAPVKKSQDTTRGASWWMSMRVECWSFWGWGIVCLCLGFWRWDCFSLNFICKRICHPLWEFLISPEEACGLLFPSHSTGKSAEPTAWGSVELVHATPLIDWERWLSSLSVALSLWQPKKKESYGWPGSAIKQDTRVLGGGTFCYLCLKG